LISTNTAGYPHQSFESNFCKGTSTY
jgi:hypothetical protein